VKIRHAIAGPAFRHTADGPRLLTTCGVWLSPELFDEDLRATCELCKARLRIRRRFDAMAAK